MVVGLAAAVVASVVTASGVWAWQEHLHQGRAKKVDVALGEAEALKRRAEDSIDDPGRWVAAREAAHQVEQLMLYARDRVTSNRIIALRSVCSYMKDLDALNSVEIRARLYRRPGHLSQALIARLDDFTAVRRVRDPKGASPLRMVFTGRVVDPDPQFDDLRAALLEKNK